jgi:KDO2-lipid IV(A) lauroyltransferase
VTAGRHGWRRRLRGRLRLALARGLLATLGHLPLPAAQRLGAVIGLLAWRLGGRSRRTIEANLARCLPDLSEGDRRRLARQSLIETGKGLIETAPVWRWPRERVEGLVVDTPGLDTLEATLREGRGALLLAPHLGNWELGGLITATRTPVTIMYRPPREAAMERLLIDARSRFGADMAPASIAGVRRALRALRRGELVAILPDQSPRRGEGVTAPFFGHPALTMTLIRTLSRRTGAPAFTGWAERLPRAEGFRIHYRQVEAAIDHADPVEAATALNREIEALVTACPAQYQWSYDRFRRQQGKRPRHEADARPTP